MVHIWHEDSDNSATTQFWNFLKKSRVCYNISFAEIRGFSGNQNLFDFIYTCNFNNKDVYLVFMDCVYDNPKVMNLYKKVVKLVNSKSNVFVLNLLSFEYLILSFKYFENWTRSLVSIDKYNYLCKIRIDLLSCIRNKDLLIYYPLLVEYMRSFQSRDISRITTEQLATHLLSDFTGSLKGDFIITKKHLGSCWTCTCCDKYTKDLVKKCSHAGNKKTDKEKALNLYHNTLARTYL